MKQDCSSIHLWTPTPVPGEGAFLKDTSLLRCNTVSNEWFEVFGRTAVPSPLNIELEPWRWRHRDPSIQELLAQQQRVTSQKSWILSHTTVKNLKSWKVHFAVSPNSTTLQINHQSDATIFQFIILTFIYSSTCFGRSPAHHQELNDCSGSLWFYLHIVVIAVLRSWSGRPARPRTQHRYHHDVKVKPEAATAVIELLMMGGRTPETCWAVNKRQDNFFSVALWPNAGHDLIFEVSRSRITTHYSR